MTAWPYLGPVLCVGILVLVARTARAVLRDQAEHDTPRLDFDGRVLEEK